jgi:drug/metabolite transporter (DMT)-like permease
MKKGLEAFSPLQVAGLRMVIASVVLLPFVLGKARRISRREWRYIVAVGIVGNGIPAFLFPLAETQINSASAGILNVLSPLFVVILGVSFFGYTYTRPQLLGVLLGLMGAIWLILAGSEVDLWQHVFYSLLVVLATVGYGLSTNLMKTYLNKTPSVLASGFALLVVALPYGLYLLTLGDLPAVFQVHGAAAWEALGYLVILAAVGTALALVMFYRLVQLTQPIFAASVTYLIPLVALGWGLWDDETISAGQMAGAAIILLGVYLANRPARRRVRPKAVQVLPQKEQS